MFGEKADQGGYVDIQEHAMNMHQPRRSVRLAAEDANNRVRTYLSAQPQIYLCRDAIWSRRSLLHFVILISGMRRIDTVTLCSLFSVSFFHPWLAG